jgi:hydroxymethylpyrimidine/phosphomethylpyrimidine kinase
MLPVALTIAGSDPSGGAGIQADLKTFHRFGVYGEAVLTLLTVQNTTGLTRVESLAPSLVIDQIDALLIDIPAQAAKTGALGTADLVHAIAARAATFAFPLVVDPVLFGKHGTPLIGGDAFDAIRTALLPRAHLITPNLNEAARLTGRRVDSVARMRDAAQALCGLGAHAALVKGGHLPDSADPVDILYAAGVFHEFHAERVRTPHTHGTGCTYSAAIAAGLARGRSLETAIREAKDFVTRAIATNPGLGRGAGPLNHWA